MSEEVQVPIASDMDVVRARQEGRALALRLGFSVSDATLIATAISELSRNIVSYARTGSVLMRSIREAGRTGMLILAADAGPGIADVPLALRDGFSSSGGLGLGLPGVRRLMDEFEIESAAGAGTRVTVRKWLP
ncbi:MAG TPA: ATP-binding protein [Steroidobacteraceae bacterium]|nr:ATP-binding protein [Steroidobacteraceae bacterium]